MLQFVIPLRSAQTTTDWEGIQELLQSTLHSVDNQISRSFRCIVIGHEKPGEIDLPESCSFVEAPFDSPAISRNELGSEKALFEMRSDKGRKLILGLSMVRDIPGSFVMFLDADDLVSNRLASLIDDNPQENGWFFEFGYRWNRQTPRLLFPRKNFYHECGSSYILKAALAPFPEEPDWSKDLDDYFIRRYEVHAYVRENMEKLGFPLAQLPFHGAIYTFNGQNLFADAFRTKDTTLRAFGRILLKGKWVNSALRTEFKIPFCR